VSVIAVLLVDKQPLVGLVDPAGGTFDAAGDFDGLLPVTPEAYPELSRIDPHGTIEFGSVGMAAIVREIERLAKVAKAGPELRGIRRLQALAVLGCGTPSAVLEVQGD
jgi:hypothetical protein